jgi:cytochrome c556
MAGVARGAACLCLLAACSAGEAPAPASQTALSMKELMERVVDPSADVFWSASGTISTAKGETSRAPKTEEGWETAVNAAATLVESGSLLMMPGRARDQKEWSAYARQLADAAAAGMKAAQAKDERAVFETGGEIYVACRSCHMKYVLGYK